MSASMNGCGYGLDDLAKAELALFKTDYSIAEEFLHKALNKSREKGQIIIESIALIFLLRVYLCRGNTAAVRVILKQIDKLQEHPGYMTRSLFHDFAYGLFYLQINRPDRISAWLKNSFGKNDLVAMIHGIELIIRVKYLIAVKHYQFALTELENRRRTSCTLHLIIGRLEAKVLEAVCRYRCGDTDGAFRDLETAWDLAKLNGFYLPFIETGKDMRALANAAIRASLSGIPSDELEKIHRGSALYARNVYSINKKFEITRNQENATLLSKRQYDILLCLAQGLTREEIARVYSISVNTVKSVSKNVYDKLGAVNRADAVRISKEMGIL